MIPPHCSALVSFMPMVSELAIVVNDIGTSYSAWYPLCVIAHNVAYLILGEGALGSCSDRFVVQGNHHQPSWI